MALRLTENVHAPYYALAIVGPIANVIEIAVTTKRRVAVSNGLAAA
jgi:hypothetical protein